jgi:hypothetical protein
MPPNSRTAFISPHHFNLQNVQQHTAAFSLPTHSHCTSPACLPTHHLPLSTRSSKRSSSPQRTGCVFRLVNLLCACCAHFSSPLHTLATRVVFAESLCCAAARLTSCPTREARPQTQCPQCFTSTATPAVRDPRLRGRCSWRRQQLISLCTTPPPRHTDLSFRLPNIKHLVDTVGANVLIVSYRGCVSLPSRMAKSMLRTNAPIPAQVRQV